MIGERNPRAAYARVELDARISASDPRALVALCFETLVAALGAALFAAERGDNRAKSQALTRAVAALTALQMGISGEAAVADALHQLYTSARRTVLDSVLHFDAAAMATIRQDAIEIAQAMADAPPAGCVNPRDNT